MTVLLLQRFSASFMDNSLNILPNESVYSPTRAVSFRELSLGFLHEYKCVYFFTELTMLDVCFLFLLQIFHPVNYLSNIAIDNAETKFVLYNDGDFITNKEAHERIKAHIAKEALKERQVSKFQIMYFSSFVYLRKVVY